MDMDEHFTNLDRVVMKTFGRTYTLTQADGSTTTLEGVLSRGTKADWSIRCGDAVPNDNHGAQLNPSLSQ